MVSFYHHLQLGGHNFTNLPFQHISLFTCIFHYVHRLLQRNSLGL
jgi:hypothetical protein